MADKRTLNEKLNDKHGIVNGRKTSGHVDRQSKDAKSTKR